MGFRDLVGGRFRRGGRGHDNGREEEDPTAAAADHQPIASGMFEIDTGVSSFQRMVNKLGTAKDTPELRDKLHKTRLHIVQLVKDTSDKLKQAREAGYGAEASDTKNSTYAKITKDFEVILKEFQKAQLLSADKATASSSDIDGSSDKSPEEQALLLESGRQEDLETENEIALNEATIGETEHGIQNIQQQIDEINGIYKDIAVLVNEQDGIHLIIENPNMHAAATPSESLLVKASRPQRANSFLIWLLLAIIVVLLIVILIMAIR